MVEMIIAIHLWIAFATLAAIVGRYLAVKWAEKRGYTALTMPMSYHAILIIVYLVIVQSGWILLYVTLIR